MASTHIARTPSSNGNQKTWTWSGWIKNNGASGDATYQYLMEAYYGNQYRYSYICLRHGTIETYGGDYQTTNSQMSFDVTTNRLLRDPSAWYHIVVAFDSTQSTSTDRLKIYINGVQETSFQGYVGSGASATFPAQNDDTFFNVTTTENRVGKTFDGSMAHVHFIDGTAYPASTFGETDSTSGIWKPKTAPSVTYGTNGFFLKFENSGNLDLDSSGNNLTFATSGTLTQNVDTPSNNFATLNPLHKGTMLTGFTFANGNNTFTGGSTNFPFTCSTLGASSGKYYAEFKTTANANQIGIGISNGVASAYIGHNPYDYAYYGLNGNILTNQTNNTAYGNGLSTNDILGVAMDLDNSKLYFSINGVFQNSGVPTSGSTGTNAVSITAPSSTTNGVYHFALGDEAASTPSVQCNFGNGYFGTTAVASANADANGHGKMEYAVPSGYYTLNTKNLKEFG